MPIINDDIVIKLKGATKEERTQIKEILLNNYLDLLNEMIEQGDYCTVVCYWKDFIPHSKPIIEPKDFIKEYGSKF